MDKTATLKAKDLDPTARKWLGVVLDVPVSDADELTVTLHRPYQEADRRAQAREELFAALHRIDENTAHVPDEEMDAAIDEAIRSVRSESR